MPTSKISALVGLVALVLSACTDSDESPGIEPGVGGAQAASTAAGTGGGTGGAAGSRDDAIVVAATDGEIALPFTISVTGAGTDRVGAVSIAGAVGTMELGGAVLPVAIYEQQPFFDYTLYQALAVAPDNWWLLWLYCQNGELTYVYSEATHGPPIDYEVASGRCVESPMPSTAHITFPAVEMPLPPLFPGYAIDGPSIQYDGTAPGTVTLGPTSLAFLPFGEVDCTRVCGTPGWLELHAVLWDQAAMRACSAILYLFEPGQPLLLTYSLTLPDLTDIAGQTQLDATWSN